MNWSTRHREVCTGEVLLLLLLFCYGSVAIVDFHI